jgi:hypothetical protein
MNIYKDKIRNMINPDLQQTLFSTPQEEALALAETSESIAKLWFNQNYLSFDISKVSELQHCQVLELTFISKLFKSNLELELINKLLLKLAKPYSYDFNDVFYNVFSNSWEYLPRELDEEEITKSYLESLNAEDDREKIEEIIKNLQDLLNEQP